MAIYYKAGGTGMRGGLVCEGLIRLVLFGLEQSRGTADKG